MKHYRIRTEKAYIDWAKRYIRFHRIHHPADLGPKDVEAFLAPLPVTGYVSPSTQNQAKSAAPFQYGDVLGERRPRRPEPAGSSGLTPQASARVVSR